MKPGAGLGPEHAALVAGCGRGFTVLCTIEDVELLNALAAVAGGTGWVIAAGPAPPAGGPWAAVRCDPATAIPVRSHVIDAAIITGGERLPELAEEVRRVLVPAGDVRVLVRRATDPETALGSASIRVVDRSSTPDQGEWVVIGRGP